MEASSHEHEEHLVPIKVFVTVWVGLITLTFVTVGAAYLDLKHMSVIVALLIASVKSTLVVMYFMHLRFEKPIFTWFFVAAIGTFVTFMLLTFADYYYR